MKALKRERRLDAGGFRSLVATMLVVLPLCASVRAQCILPYDNTKLFSPDPTFGGEFAVNMDIRDMNHDGFSDVVATDALKTASGVNGAGKVFILYGPTLTTWSEIVAAQPKSSEYMGRRDLSVGDVNGDGEWDVLVGSPGYDLGAGSDEDQGRAHLFLGPSFTTEFLLNDPVPQVGGNFGRGVALEDLSGDGLDDVVVGAPNKSFAPGPHPQFTNCGQALVWAATRLDGTPVIIPNPLPATNAGFGQYLDSVPSRGGIGRDLIVAAPSYFLPPPCFCGTGLLFRFDGSSLGHLTTIAPPGPAFLQFAEVFHVGDIDSDGEEDMFVGAFDGIGKATILLGPNFTTALATVSERVTPNMIFATTGAMADLDQDGVLDMLVGDPGQTSQQGLIRIYWGPDYSIMDNLGCTTPPSSSLGNGLAAGDIDGDGFPEVLTQYPGGFSGGVLRVWKRRTLQADASSLSISAGAAVHFTLDLSAAQAGKLYVAALSLTDPGNGLVLGPGIYLPLRPDAMTNIGLSLLNTPILQGFAGVLDAAGHASFTLNWPPGAGGGLVGQTLHVAAITATPPATLSVGSSQAAISLLP